MMKSDTPKFALVPVEPTEEMMLMGFAGYRDSFGTPITRQGEAYKAMISAAPKPDCVGVDTQAILDAFVEANDSDGYPFKGEEYDLNLIKFFLDWCNAQGLLAVKEKAQTAEDDLRMFGQSFERISEDGKRTRISPLDVYDKAQERGEHPCDWQDEENKGGRS